MKQYKTIFIFAYYSYADPLFQSAILPYFIGLNKMESNLRFVLLTFEQEQFQLSKEKTEEVKNELLNENIIWYSTKWHSGRFKFLKKTYDILQSFLFSSFIILRYRVDKIYSEAFPGAVMSHWLSRLFRKQHLIHSFEPHTQYMLEAGVWNENSWEVKLLKKYEIKVAKSASHILTATQEMIQRLQNLNTSAKLIKAPSCVDTDLFKFSSKDRRKIRDQLGIGENDIVIIYLGKFGGMYMEEEIFSFFQELQKNQKLSFRFIILTGDDRMKLSSYISKFNLSEDKVYINKVSRDQVPGYLSASDYGFVAVRQYPGKRFCSPIKDGEYWSCGLPIIIPKGISDDYVYADREGIGIVIDDMSSTSIEKLGDKLVEWRKMDRGELRQKCRSFAIKDRSVDKFKKTYLDIFTD